MSYSLRGLAVCAFAAVALSSCRDGAPGPAVESRTITARGGLAENERATIELFQNAAPSVALVLSRAPTFGGGRTEVGAGTGFIWDTAGHLVTNNHVVQSPEILVRTPTGEDIPATVVGRAPQYDIAVLRLARTTEAPPLALGTSSDLLVGQSVFAIGNPFGLDQTLTSGIVSAVERNLPTGDGREIAGVIQTDAAINPGNSGGPLLDSAGRVIGMNTAIYSPSGAYAGVGFAVPIDTIARVVPLLIANGRAPVAGIGILAADPRVGAQLGVDGVLVWRTIPGGAAAGAGLRGTDPQSGVLGDVIVAVNGEPVENLAELTTALDRVGVGNVARLTLRRGDQNRDVEITVEDIGAR
jgi:2-alkenal reductase